MARKRRRGFGLVASQHRLLDTVETSQLRRVAKNVRGSLSRGHCGAAIQALTNLAFVAGRGIAHRESAQPRGKAKGGKARRIGNYYRMLRSLSARVTAKCGR